MDSHQFLSCAAKMLCAVCFCAPELYNCACRSKSNYFCDATAAAGVQKAGKSRQATSAVLCLKGEVNHPADAARAVVCSSAHQARLPIKAEATFQIYRDTSALSCL
jgi:hypothetical protein